MIEDTRIKIFQTVCEEGSFTRAAKKLGISQPAVSQNIAELEKCAGAPLFERKKGSMALTNKGQAFKEYADQISYWYNALDSAFNTPSPIKAPTAAAKKVRIAVDPGLECHLYSGGSSEADIELELKGDDIRIITTKKQRSLDDLAAES